MPSGVSHGAAPGDAEEGASANVTLEKSGIRVICGAEASAVVSLKNIVGRIQCRQGIAAFVNEGLHARPAQRVVRAGPPGEIDVARAAFFKGCDCGCEFRFGKLAGCT